MEHQSTKNTSSLWNQTRVSSRLGIEYPIIQGPLGGLSTQRLTAAVSNFGGLGSFGAHGLSPAAIKDVIAEIRALTAKPFAMNLWVSMEDEGARSSNSEAFSRSLGSITGHIQSLGGKLPAFTPYTPVTFEDQVRVLLDAKVPVFSFIVGIPPHEILDECRRQGIVTIGTATTPDEAIALEQAGVDLVVASGFEAGGHRGSFLRSSEDSLTGTFSLVPQVVDAVSVPVIAAGGVGDARGIVAAFALGAAAAQIGTAYLHCPESQISPLYRRALKGTRDNETAIANVFTGRPARAIVNRFMLEVGPMSDVAPEFPLAAATLAPLRAKSEMAGSADFTPFWSGQAARLGRQLSAEELTKQLAAEALGKLGSLQTWHPGLNKADRHKK